MTASGFRPGVVDYERQAEQYAAARALSSAGIDAWRESVLRHLGPLSPRLVLDLGSGTGRFSPLLAQWLGCSVVGVEPSPGMREAAMRESAHPAVTYLGGDAEHIPLGNATCDAACIAYVIHHVPDRIACARELARALKSDGVILVVGAYTEARKHISLFRYFPSALKVVDAFPLEREIAADFTAGGLEHAGTEGVIVESAPSLAVAVKRVSRRADSTLQLISDAEFDEGLRRLSEAAAEETEPRPIHDRIDLLVFRRP